MFAGAKAERGSGLPLFSPAPSLQAHTYRLSLSLGEATSAFSDGQAENSAGRKRKLGGGFLRGGAYKSRAARKKRERGGGRERERGRERKRGGRTNKTGGRKEGKSREMWLAGGQVANHARRLRCLPASSCCCFEEESNSCRKSSKGWKRAFSLSLSLSFSRFPSSMPRLFPCNK